ncbi:MAG TPA: hypothetical protein VIK30_10570 [Polyangia bacterium]|jgi:hypothetical protein
MFSRVIRLAVTSFALFQIGCATTGSSFVHTDAEVELAQRQTEDETLSRLASSRNDDIADAASTLARQRATR